MLPGRPVHSPPRAQRSRTGTATFDRSDRHALPPTPSLLSAGAWQHTPPAPAVGPSHPALGPAPAPFSSLSPVRGDAKRKSLGGVKRAAGEEGGHTEEFSREDEMEIVKMQRAPPPSRMLRVSGRRHSPRHPRQHCYGLSPERPIVHTLPGSETSRRERRLGRGVSGSWLPAILRWHRATPGSRCV